MSQEIVRRMTVGLALAGSFALPAGSAWAAGPELRFEQQAVVIVGVTPASRLALFGISRGFNGFTGYELRHDEVLTAGSDGTARLDLDLPVSPHSVWAAVEMSTGEVGLAAPKGSELREVRQPAGAIDVEGRTVTEARRYADALWVRPGDVEGAGVWGARLGDGAAGDEDGVEDRSIRAHVSAFVPASRESDVAPPERLTAGDVLVIIDPETLEVSVSRVSE